MDTHRGSIRAAGLYILLLGFCTAGLAETLQISSGVRAPLSTPQHNGFNDLITREAFKRAGYDIDILYLPPARALQDLNDGIVDADLVRVVNISEMFPGVIVVPEKIIDFDFVAISRGKEFRPQGWESLRPYEVGIVSGWKILERNVKSNGAVTRVEDTRQLMRILDNERIDIAVSEMWQARQAILELGLKSVTIHQPPIKSNEMFLVVNKKHKKLVPKLAAAIRDMKQDGSFQRIYDMTLGKLKKQ